MTINRKTASLFSLRISIFLVMFMWTIDKFINPAHATKVYQKFYGINLGGNAGDMLLTALAAAELLLLAAFLLGVKRRITYGTVLILHGVSTLSSWQQYANPFEGPNLLFFAAWPMLAACFTLYLYRDEDQLLTIEKLR